MPGADQAKRDRFVQEYIATGNARQSAISAGVPEKSASVVAYKWLRNREITDVIRSGMDQMLRTMAPKALNVIAELIEDPKVPASIRLGACRDVLDRANYVPPKREVAARDISTIPRQQLTRAELDELVREGARNKKEQSNSAEQ
ncbi:MAG: terminase small subunit [Rhodospirillaceae bacterium]